MTMIARGCHRIALAPLPFVILSIVLFMLDAVYLPIVVALMLLQLMLLLFFRDPRRAVGDGVVSPADGTILEADGTISVFMNLWNVHVNRAPLGGTVTAMEHLPGRHAPAFQERGDNERLHVELSTEHGDVTVTQIAGLVARRIVPYITEGETVEKGQRIGIIRFGSKVSVRLPPGATPTVAEGDRVRAGQTVAVLN